MNRAVFLDRDDTLIANRDLPLTHPGDLLDPALVRLLPGAARACRDLKDAGFTLVVVTNQGGVARGHGSIDDVHACNDRLLALIQAESGATIDAVYYCPYHPRGTVAPFNIDHPWRKPAPGMFTSAAADLHIDLAASWAIGDAPRDIEAARAAGIPPSATLLVGPGAPYASVDRAAAHVISSIRRDASAPRGAP